VQVPYGRAPRALDLGEREIHVLAGAPLPRPRPLPALLDAALESLALPAHATRITIIVSDATRDEPRVAMLRAICDRLPDAARITLAIATGTHGPAPRAFVDELVVVDPRIANVVNHDGHDDRRLVSLGTTARGTPIIVHRCLVDAELVIATGCIRPHYFAGFGAGAKALFPGLGQAAAIRLNHRWKSEPGARAGVLDDNPCREDLEEAVAAVPVPVLLVNGVCGPDRALHQVVVGALHDAFRRGCALARPWFTVRARPAALVIASDDLPVTASLYQAAKLAAAVAPLVAPNGTLVLAAECMDGIGPEEIVNEAIFRIGVLPRLAPGVSLQLLSSLPPSSVARTLLSPCDLDTLSDPKTPMILVPNASSLICEATS